MAHTLSYTTIPRCDLNSVAAACSVWGVGSSLLTLLQRRRHLQAMYALHMSDTCMTRCHNSFVELFACQVVLQWPSVGWSCFRMQLAFGRGAEGVWGLCGARAHNWFTTTVTAAKPGDSLCAHTHLHVHEASMQVVDIDRMSALPVYRIGDLPCMLHGVHPGFQAGWTCTCVVRGEGEICFCRCGCITQVCLLSKALACRPWLDVSKSAGTLRLLLCRKALLPVCLIGTCTTYVFNTWCSWLAHW